MILSLSILTSGSYQMIPVCKTDKNKQHKYTMHHFFLVIQDKKPHLSLWIMLSATDTNFDSLKIKYLKIAAKNMMGEKTQKTKQKV